MGIPGPICPQVDDSLKQPVQQIGTVGVGRRGEASGSVDVSFLVSWGKMEGVCCNSERGEPCTKGL